MYFESNWSVEPEHLCMIVLYLPCDSEGQDNAADCPDSSNQVWHGRGIDIILSLDV